MIQPLSVLAETKLNDSFPNSQFSVNGFSEPLRIDRNRSESGVMIYVWDDTPSKLLKKHFLPNHIEGLFAWCPAGPVLPHGEKESL